MFSCMTKYNGKYYGVGEMPIPFDTSVDTVKKDNKTETKTVAKAEPKKATTRKKTSK